MARNTHRQPKSVMAESPAAPEGNVTQLATAGMGTRPSLLSMQRTTVTQHASDKMALLGTVRQQLAEAADGFKLGGETSAEATETAVKAGTALYQACVSAVMTTEEVSQLLGDAFGFKMKGPANNRVPGKEPDGYGGALRKRIVRAVSAYEYVTDGDGGAFFEGLPVDAYEYEDEEHPGVADVVAKIGAEGGIGIWTAYDALAKIKRENAERLPPAFDPKRIAAIVQGLARDDAAVTLLNSNDLQAVYRALQDAIAVVDEAAAVMLQQREAEAA